MKIDTNLVISDKKILGNATCDYLSRSLILFVSLFSLLFLFPKVVFCQNQNLIDSSVAIDQYLDSLNNLLAENLDAKAKLEIYWQMADYAMGKNSDQIIYYCQKGLVLSEKLNLKNYSREFYLWMGVAYDDKAEYANAIKSYKDGLSIIKNQQQNEEGKKGGLFYEEAIVYNNLGYAVFQMGRHDEALDYYLKGLKIAEEKAPDCLSILQGSISELYLKINDLSKAKKYALLALENSKQIFDISANCIMLADLFEKEQMPDSSFFYYKKAYALAQNQPDRYLKGMSTEGLVRYHLARKNYSEVLDYAASGLKNGKEANIVIYIVSSYLALAKANSAMGDYELAKTQAVKALELSLSSNSTNAIIDCYKTLESFYKNQEKYREAYFYKTLLQNINDSILTTEKLTYIAEAENLHLLQKKEAENEILKLKQAENLATIQRRNLVIYAAAIFIFLALVCFFLLFRNIKQRERYNQELEKEVEKRTATLKRANNELERFNNIISHDLKEPLRNIISFSSLSLRKLNTHNIDEIKDYLAYIKNSALQLNTLVADVLEFARVGNKRMATQPINLNKLLDRVVDNLKLKIAEKNGVVKYRDLPVIDSNDSLLFVLYKNLIENSIKYNDSQQPSVSIEHIEEDEQFVFQVKDNGIGIEEEYHDKIFGMFQRLHHRHKYEGTGLGLSLCKKITEQLGGDIKVVESSKNGTTFQLSFPKKKIQ